MVGLQFYYFPTKEGLETRTSGKRIRRKDGKKVKRKKKIIREPNIFDDINNGLNSLKELPGKIADGFNKVGEIFNKITDGFNQMIDFFKKVGEIFNFIPRFFKYLGEFMMKVLNNILQCFLFIPTLFLWIGEYIKGGIKFITNLPKCFKWYALEVFGNIIYSPFKFIFWVFDIRDIENMIWNYAEDFDCAFKKLTGYHIIHYPRDIQLQCYTFCPPDFTKFPDLDWSFNPPTISINF
jgi:hypothetical protein